MKKIIPLIVLAALTAAGCSSVPTLKTVPRVDIERYMGDWYVIAAIPTFIEKEAYNAVESYKLAEDGTVETTFTFRKGGFDGPLKTYRPRGFIRDKESNSVWGMQFVWPFKGEFLIVYLNDDYSQTVIGRSKLDYVWVMAKTPEIPEEDYRKTIDFLSGLGYDTSKIRKVPQNWGPR